MELIWLETFIVLAESSSVRSAASKLNISPATVSERIAALEDYLGTKLLVRSSKGSELTEAGKLYISSANQILNNWDNMLNLVRPFENDHSQKLSIGLPDHMIPPGLGRFLDNYMVERPQIELNLYSDQEISILESLQNRITDIFFVFEPKASILKSMTAIPIHKTSMGILIPADHRLALKSSVSIKELDGETFILYPEFNDSSLHAFQEKMLKESGIRYLEYGGHFSSSLFVLPVKMGCGIVICPRIMKRGLPPRTAFLNITDDIATCHIYMVYDPSNNNPALLQFLEAFDTTEGVDES